MTTTKDILVPRSAKKALSEPRWKAAMTDEFNALVRNKTWILVPRNSDDRVINTKWVFKVKHAEDGSVQRLKARWVANGMRQIEGCDYDQTFSPVVKANSIRIVFTIAISRNWVMKQIDVSNAFLHGNIDERILVTQPVGFEDATFPNHVCLLKKALYGLKQSPRMWYRRLREFLIQIKFFESYSDPSLFICKDGKDVMFLFSYVDDIVLTGSSATMVDSVIQKMAGEFAIRELGNVNFFLGIHVCRTPGGLHLSQQKYLRNLLESCGMIHSKPASTPMLQGGTFPDEEGQSPDQRDYRRIIGSLQYLTLTRPDIQYSVNKLSQFLTSPSSGHWVAMKRLLRYLAGTQQLGITLNKVRDFNITCYCDADWGGDLMDRKSHTGYLIYIGDSLVAWSSKKQAALARSSTEAEYRAVATTVEEAEGIRSLLSELDIKVPLPINILTDNRGASFIANNPICHSKMKHVAMDFHFVREKSEAGIIKVDHISGKSQLADLLTKPLAPKLFQQWSGKLVGLCPSV